MSCTNLEQLQFEPLQSEFPQSDSDWDEMYYQRWLVLRAPLGMARGTEQDVYDQGEAVYLIVKLIDKHQQQIVGSARLRQLSPQLGSLAYVAVLPEFQQQGIGTQLIQRCIDIARHQGLQQIRAMVRLEVLGFYEKLGFSVQGRSRDYLGLPHCFVYRDLLR